MPGSRTTQRPTPEALQDTIDWLLDVVGPELRAEKAAREAQNRRLADQEREAEPAVGD